MKVEIGSRKKLFNLTVEQRTQIKNDLTLDNPQYFKALKYSRYGSVKIPKYLRFYSENKAYLEIPRGYEVPFDIEEEIDLTFENTVTYPDFQLQLRQTQQEAFNHYIKDTSKGIIILPTGKGKSILGCYIASQLKQKTLIIVHKDDLVSGWKADADLCFGGKLKTGLIKARKRKIGEQITIATIQTLNRLSEEDLILLTETFGLIIVDECLVADTLIVMDDGGFMTIDQIQNKDHVLGGEVSNKFSRQSKRYVVESRMATLEGSPTHPTFVLKKEKLHPKLKNSPSFSDLEECCLQDIKVGDYIPVLKRIPHTTKYNWTPEELSLVAMIQADGHLDIRGNRVKLNITKDVDYYINTYKQGIESLVSRGVIPSTPIKISKDTRGNTTIWTTDPTFKHLLEDSFLIPRGKKSTQLRVSPQVQYSSLDSIKAYIETLFSCEGDLNISNSSRLNLGMTSKLFIQEVSLLLKKFGILSNIQFVDKKENNAIYRLSISGNYFNTFYASFTLIERKMTNILNKTVIKGYDIGDYHLARVTESYATKDIVDVYDYTTTSHTFIANGVLTHNCHHAPSSSFDLIQFFRGKYRVGLTATPERTDGLTPLFNFHFGGVAYQFETKEHDEDILPVLVKIHKLPEVVHEPKVKVHGKEIPLSKAPKNGNFRINYHEIDEAVVKNPKYVRKVVNDVIREYNEDRSIIMFFNKKEHCRYYFDYLKERGVPVEEMQLYYGDAKESKDEMKRKAESKEVLITLATYSIATEGTNVKQWEVAFLVSSINNEKNVEQAVGRIRRTKQGKINPVIVHDYSLPNVSIISRHIHTRTKRYEKLLFKIQGTGAKRILFGGKKDV